MQSLEINSNLRIDPLLGDTQAFDYKTAKRIVDIALPFICMNAQCGQVVNVGLGVLHVYEKLNCNSSLELQNLFEVGLVVSTTAMAIFFPLGQILLSNSVQLATDSYQLCSSLYHYQEVESLTNLLSIINTLIYVASIFYASPMLLGLSLSIQGLKELYAAQEAFFKDHQVPESLAKIVLACIRFYSAAPHIRAVHRNYFGKQLTQEDLEIIFLEDYFLRFKDPKRSLNLSAILEEKGFSSFIKGLDFTEREFEKLCLTDVVFEKCHFGGLLFDGALFNRVCAYGCQFDGARWVESRVQQCFFDHCSFVDGAFVSSLISHSLMISPDCKRIAWDHSFISNLLMFRPDLNQSTFLGTTAQNSWIAYAQDLTDTLFCGNQGQFNFIGQSQAVKTKPVIALPWNFRNEGYLTPVIKDALYDSGMAVLRFEMYPKGISDEKLTQEVTTHLNSINPASHQPGSSIPEKILRNAEKGSQIDHITKIVANVLSYCDGLSLPGGPDIQPRIYGAIQEDQTHSEVSYLRTIIEIAAIKKAIAMQIPIMGTCRGSQILNVYLGGTLHQHIENNSVHQVLEITDSPKSEWIRDRVGETFNAIAMHHQAVNQLGDGVHVLYTCDGIVKLFTTEDGLILGSQVHPETYTIFIQWLDEIREINGDHGSKEYEEFIEQNRMIYKIFLERVEDFKRKRLAVCAVA